MMFRNIKIQSKNTVVNFLPITKEVGCCTSAFSDNVEAPCSELKVAECYSITRASLMSRGCLLDVSEGKHIFYKDTKLLRPEDFKTFDEVKASMMKHDLFQSKGFLLHLKTMEETLLRDTFHKQMLCFHGLHEAHKVPLYTGVADSSRISDTVPKMDWLLTFSCSLCNGQRVTMVDWNQVYVDVLAVGYEIGSSSNQDEAMRGMVLIWSLKNPNHPQHQIYVDSSVSCIAFSSERPSLLSVGTENGTILLYETCQPGQNRLLYPIADSSFTLGTSKSAIRQLKWKCKSICMSKSSTRGKVEFLYSVNSDGEVIEWSTEKGLYISSVLMKFKHTSTYPESLRATMGALCLEFFSSHDTRSHDEQSYLVGTEDGKIHRCSFANVEHPLETLDGHEAPVCRIYYHPSNSGSFLSCSEDCSVKLWSKHVNVGGSSNEVVLQEEKMFRPEDLWDAVNDISWSFTSPNIFASVTEDGRLLLYDISKIKSDPILTQYSSHVGNNQEREAMSLLKVAENEAASQFSRNHHMEQQLSTKGDAAQVPALTCVSFHGLCPVLVVGDAIGNAIIFKCS
jgi:hypothetical protein